MRTSLIESTDGKLLVDIERGQVLRADDYVIVSERYLETHPFIRRGGDVVIAGPTGDDQILDQTHFEVVRDVAGFVHLQKIED